MTSPWEEINAVGERNEGNSPHICGERNLDSALLPSWAYRGQRKKSRKGNASGSLRCRIREPCLVENITGFGGAQGGPEPV